MKRAASLLIAAFALCAGVLTLFTAPTLFRHAASNASESNLAFQPHPGARLPLSASLVDEAGRTVTLGDYFTKTPVIVVLEYLHCTSLCGVTLRHLVAATFKRVPLEPQRDYQLVAISIDPRDKPADAAAAHGTYANLLDGRGGAGLHFLTGSETAVRQIADTVGFSYQYDSLLDAYIHPAGFVIATPDGLISRYVEGIAITPREFVAAIADAEQEKSQSLITRLALLCHVQGAPLGRFTVPVLAAFTIANIAAGMIAIAIFATVRRKRYG
jgi:protein SCO1